MKKVYVQLYGLVPDNFDSKVEEKLDQQFAEAFNTLDGELEESKEYAVFDESGDEWGTLPHQIKLYNEYIQNANEEDRYAEGWFPVCFNEFVDNEYEAYKEDAGVL